MQFKKSLTKEQAYQKLKHYCGYQERCHTEVKTKAYSLGLKKGDVDELTSKLIEEDYLNEERFARLFAGGKFRQKQWGKMKIIQELKSRGVSEYCIKKGIKEIRDEDYMNTLQKLAIKKWDSVRGRGVNRFVKMAKIRDYLLLKGYEASLITETMKELP